MTVLANDNGIRVSYNAHDADTGIHVQSSTLANRPSAGTAGRKWLTTDGLRVYYDTGASWSEIAYLNTQAASTLTSTTSPQLTIAYDGSNNLAISVSSAGAVTLNATGAGAAFTISDSLTVAGTQLIFSGSVGLSVIASGAAFGYGTGAGGTVTQITNASTGVTLSKYCGQITTVALSTVAGAEEEFTWTNSFLQITDAIAVTTTYTGAGTPAVSIKGVAGGSCVINITNLHSANALNAAVTINVAVLRVVTS